MRKCIPSALLACFFSSLLLAADLDSLVQEYNKLKSQLGRGGRGGGGGALRGGRRGGGGRTGLSDVESVLYQIGELGTDRALKFLLDEVGRARRSLATLSARAILKSDHPLAPKLLFKDFGRRQPEACLAILDAVLPADRTGGGGPGPGGGPWAWRRMPEREPVKIDWKKIDRQLLQAARIVKDVAVRRRLIPALVKLDPRDAARGIVQVAATQGKPRPGEESLYAEAIKALVDCGKAPEAREWLRDEAFSFAKSNPGMLAVIAESAGRLGIAEALPEMERLLTSRSDRLVAAASEGLSRLPGGLSETSIKAMRRQLKRRSSVTIRAKVLDSLARSGALEVVLELAEKGDMPTRAIAMGSLALARDKPKVLEALLAALGDKAVEVRSNALRALRGVKRKAAIPALIEHLDAETVHRMKADALQLLVDLTGHNMGFVAEDWRKWWGGAKESQSFAEAKKKSKTIVVASYFGIGVSSKRLAFLLDVSWSMDWRGGGPGWGRGGGRGGGGRGGGGKAKIDLLKEELTRLLTKLSGDAYVNIITFDETVRTWRKKLEALAGGGRERAIKFVRGLETGPGTNVFDSVELALQDRRVDTIYLLTDGQPTTGRYTETEGILRGVRELNRVRAVTIHCIAFGEPSKLLERLAEENGGVYRFVANVEGERGGEGGGTGPSE